MAIERLNKTNRTADSMCLLCRANKADKKNTHIIPKFLTENLVRQPESNRSNAAFVTTAHPDSPPLIVQDTYKEDYLWCSKCEEGFAVVERMIKNSWFDQHKKGTWHEEVEKTHGVKVRYFKDVDPKAFQLFIYSIYWRCSVAQGLFFQPFKMESNYEERLRIVLANTLLPKETDFKQKLKKSGIRMPKSNFILLAGENITDATTSVMAPHPQFQDVFIYILLVGEFHLFLSPIENEFHDILHEHTCKFPNSERVKMSISTNVWNETVNQFLSHLRNGHIVNAEKAGTKPFWESTSWKEREEKKKKYKS
jgi:hypothetical protein